MDNCTGKELNFPTVCIVKTCYKNDIYTQFVQIRQLPLFAMDAKLCILDICNKFAQGKL